MAEVDPEVQAFIRREVQRQVQQSPIVNGGQPVITPEEWDLQIVKASEFPGHGYELHSVVVVHVDVFIVWRIRRDKGRTIPGWKPVIKLPGG